MALKVWLKLTKENDISNTGADGVEFSGSPNSWTNGFMGKCATFSGNIDNRIYSTSFDYNYTDDFSWAVWVCTSATTVSGTHYVFTVGRADGPGYGYGLHESSNDSLRVWYGNAHWSVSCSGGVWTHIAFVKHGTNIKIYKNGAVVINTTFSGTTPTYEAAAGVGIGCFYYAGGSIYPYIGSLCDFRIYDHALSHLEVNDIAKALVCHYTFDDISSDQFNHSKDNNFINSTSSSVTYYPDTDAYEIVSKYGDSVSEWGSTAAINTNCNSVPFGSYYRVSMDIYIPTAHTVRVDTNNYPASGSAWNGNDNDLISGRRYSFPVVAGQWAHCYIIGYNNDALNTNKVALRVSDRIGLQTRNDTAATTWWIKNYKFETSQSSDFSTVAVTSEKTVYDNSGFGNNGTMAKPMLISNDNVRGHNSLYFAGTDSVSISPWLSTGQTVTEMTISLWYKTNTLNDTTPNLISLGNNKFCRFRLNNATTYWTYVSVAGKQESDTFTNGSVHTTDNAWHMVTLVIKDGWVSIYHDGNRIGTASNHSGDGGYFKCDDLYWLLGCYIHGSEHFVGYEDDVRIYMKGLSPEDVLRLYKTSIHVGKNSSVDVGALNEWIENVNPVIFDYKMNANVAGLDESSDYTVFQSTNSANINSAQIYSADNRLSSCTVFGNVYIDKLHLGSASELYLIDASKTLAQYNSDSSLQSQLSTTTANNTQVKKYIDDYFASAK